jgi:hypothetical protein
MPVGQLIERPQPGEYFADERDLFRVERIFGDRALIEDCRTGVLLDIAVRELLRLRHVEPSGQAATKTASVPRPHGQGATLGGA